VFAALTGYWFPLSLALSRKGRGPGRGGRKLVSAANTSIQNSSPKITQNYSNYYSILEPAINMADHAG